ncbi:unnamed protein product [Phytophthora fragariaefolia]|uniref:Unnamed protein product n=1 Tax=Phytophthora fragariaefolia TaxID=1490495 RepID=A0A9W7D0I9_9STRA|nr:unnamed protein product [Phytophthora fragariaefolia]
MHPEFEETYWLSVATDAPLSSFGFVTESIQHRNQCQWVVERNGFISELDNPLTRSMPSWKPVSTKTLKLDMQTCATNVGGWIEKELDEVFGVMWGGWTHGPVHYVGIIGVTVGNGKRCERLL